MDNNPNIVIVGASSAMAEHCARHWVQRKPTRLTLIGRDETRLERVASDLRVRSPQSEVRVVIANFLDPAAIQATVDGISTSSPVDIVLIAHGFLPEQTNCQNDLHACQEALQVNGISPVLYAEAFANSMARNNRGTLVLISSVAGDRGRKSNYVYGSAKSMVTRYAQGLQHRFAKTGVKVVLIKPGPTDTPMAAHLKEKGIKLASVEAVAKKIVIAVDRGTSIAYVPWKWQMIMMIIRHLPAFIFNKINI